MKDNITKRLLDEYFIASSVTVNVLNCRFFGVVVCGEFCELVLKYLLNNYSKSNSSKTHNLSKIFTQLNRTANNKLKSRVKFSYNKLSINTKNTLRTIDYSKFRYCEAPKYVQNSIFEVFKVCQKLYLEIIVSRNRKGKQNGICR